VPATTICVGGGQRRERDGPAARGHDPRHEADCVVRSAVGAFLAEAVDHQQAVGDCERDAGEDDDANRVVADVHQDGHAAQQDHRAGDGHLRAGQRTR
jgi:hypothetical protein